LNQFKHKLVANIVKKVWLSNALRIDYIRHLYGLICNTQLWPL